MNVWAYVLIIDYVISFIGLIANLVYLKLVVIDKFYDGYWRIASFIISSAMILVILSHIISSIICLAYDGSYFPSTHCGKIKLYFLMDYLNTYGEFSIAAGIFIMVFERYASVFFPSFRLSSKYKIWFSGLIVIYLISLAIYMYLMRIDQSAVAQLSGFFAVSLLYAVSLLLAIYLFFSAKNRYYKTLGQISLTERYLLSESYELCQNTFAATLCALVINTSLFISFWFFVLGWIPFYVMYEYFLIYDITLNISATLFPILFLNDSKKIRRQILKMKGDNRIQDVTQLNGQKINISQTQEEYFQQLQISWT